MDIKLDRPLVFFDLETTGVSFSEDRIIEVALLKVHPSGEEEAFDSLVNPGMPIPPESTAIHGIKDEMVKDKPAFAQLSAQLLGLFDKSDLGGFGVSRFDIPMLAAEFKRSGFLWSMEGRRVIDAMKIFHRMEPRNLSAALKFYCGKEFKAHRAAGDTRASWEVFAGQLARYPDLPRDAAGLHDFCCAQDPQLVDPEGKFVWGKDQRACFNFGKYKLVPLESVAQRDPSYLMWFAGERGTPRAAAEICRNALRGRFPSRRNG